MGERLLEQRQICRENGVAGEQGDQGAKARKGPNGMYIFRAPSPCLAKSTVEKTRAESMPTIIPTETAFPSPAPSRSASFTSPMPIPFGYATRARKRKREAPSEQATHSTVRPGSSAMLAASTTAKEGSTMRSGRMRRSASMAERTTSAAQKYAATRARPDRPKRRNEAAIRSAVASSTAG
jgi:hypothetical protein